MKTVKVSDLKEGIMFTKPVFLDGNNIFVMEYQPVTEKDISRLRNWHMEELLTEGDIVDKTSLPSKPDETGARIKSTGFDDALLDIEDYFKKPFDGFDWAAEAKNLNDDGITKDYAEIRNTALRKMADVVENIKADKYFNADVVKDIVNGFVISIEKDKKNFIKLVNKFIPGEYYIVHSVNTCILSLIMGSVLGYNRIRQMSLGLGALLHDIGMIKLPKSITHKKGKLTEDEFNIVRTHPLLGYKLLFDSGKFSQDVLKIVLQHHERDDGKGYPRKVKGDTITDMSKIVQIASVYEAMICKRTYRDEHQYFQAMRQILNGCQGEFDSRYLKLFLSVMSYYPIGTYVELNDRRICEVVSANARLPMKPVVEVIIDASGHPIRNGDKIDLASDSGVFIVKPVDTDRIKNIRASMI